MASGERRLGSARRAMTVLGKIPTPSVPKPINLPSQRLENQGLEPNVDLVPRGTFTWGCPGRPSTVIAGKEEGTGITSSPPTIAVAGNDSLKIQGLSTSGNESGSLIERSSAGNDVRPSSAPTDATFRGWCDAKTKVEVQVQSSGVTEKLEEPAILESQRIADLTSQQNGTVMDTNVHPHPGVTAHASFGASSAGPGPENFEHLGDGYKGPWPFTWQRMPPAGGHKLPGQAGPYSGRLSHELYHSPSSVPLCGNMAPRGDVGVSTMANGLGVDGSFPSHHLRLEGFFEPHGEYGGYRSVFRPGEQFPSSAISATAASSSTPGMSIGFSLVGHTHSLQEGDGQFGKMSMNGSSPALQRDVDIHSLSTFGNECNYRTPRTFERQNYASGEHGSAVKECVTPMTERKITLLTKVRVDAPTTETISNDSTLLLVTNRGKDVCQQEAKLSKIDTDKSEVPQSSSLGFDVKGLTNDNLLASKKSDSGAAKISMQEVAISKTEGEIQKDAVTINVGKDQRTETQAAVAESSPLPIAKFWRKTPRRNAANALSSAQRLPTSTSIENIKHSALKGQINDCLKSDVSEHGIKASKQSHEGSSSSAILELGFSQKSCTTIYIDNQSCLASAKSLVGIDSEAVGSETPKPIVQEDISGTVDPKAETKALYHRTEKEWRPKSPVVEAKAPSFRFRKGGKRGEQLCNTDLVKDLSSQDCSKESVVLETSSECQTQKSNTNHLLGNLESFSWSRNSSSNSNKEARFILTDDSSSAHSGIHEGSLDQPSQSKNEQTFEIGAFPNCNHSSVRSAVQVLQTEYIKELTTEGLVLKGDCKAKSRQSIHKREKEWRPKSPAVESAASCNNSLSASQDSKAKETVASPSDTDIKIVSEQEASQPPDAYDYEGQRAKLKEIAAQRAKQRRKEEEDRIKERKAKALAKLEELNRRMLGTSSAQMAEQCSVVSVDEAFSKKIKKKLNSSRRSSVDVRLYESCAWEDQHVDGNMVSAPVRSSTSTTFETHSIAEVGEDLSSDDALSQPLNSAEKHRMQEWPPATSSNEERRQQFRKERRTFEEDLAPVNDTEAELFSNKKFGAEIRKGDPVILDWTQGGGQQTTDHTWNQGGKAAETYRNERKGTLDKRQDVEQPYLLSSFSQSGEFHDKGGIPGKAVLSRKQRQTTVEVQKQSNAGEPSLIEEQSSALYSPRIINQSRKSHKGKNVGKTLKAGRHQERQISVEVRDHHVREERKTAVSGSGKSESQEQNGVIFKNDAEARATEHGKTVQSLNSGHQKSVNGNHMLKQGFIKDMNNRYPEFLALTEAGFGEKMADPAYLHALPSNNPHNPPPRTNQSFKPVGAPSGHIHRPMKVSKASSSQIPLEKHAPVQMNSLPRHSRSTVPSRQDWKIEQAQESESLTAAGHSRKWSSQLQAEPTLNFEGDLQNLNHQPFYSGNSADTISDQHMPAITSKNRFNHAHTESRKINRTEHGASQAFRPHERRHEAETEIRYNRGEQHSRGRNKPYRDSPVNGCSSTFAELDRMGSESAIKTEISH